VERNRRNGISSQGAPLAARYPLLDLGWWSLWIGLPFIVTDLSHLLPCQTPSGPPGLAEGQTA